MIQDPKNPELFIGLVAPIGANTSIIKSAITDCLSALNYEVSVIKLSEILKKLVHYNNVTSNEVGEAKRIDILMKTGDKLRSTTRDPGSLAKLGILNISEERIKIEPQGGNASRRAYIIDSIKHPDELKFFRQVYGKLFFSFSIFQTRENRIKYLAEILALSSQGMDTDKFRPKAEEFIERDYNTDGGDVGQNVRDAFPLSDAFVKVDHRGIVEGKIKRIIEAWFGHPYHTPNIDEYGMFMAKSAALRSADLARQVGAAILSKNGEMITVGCNEVPHAFGAIKWTGDAGDKRDFVIGYDVVVKVKKQMISEIIRRFKDADLLKGENSVEELVESLISGDKKAVLKDSRVTNIIEFGRVVHAEMTAITEAARRGTPIKDAILYCTTFPCHMCARHIIASGISKVVYIEPYPKSMARDLYNEIIAVDEAESANLVCFQSFEGIGPNRYLDIFEMGNKKRKNKTTGDVVPWPGKDANPIVDFHYSYYHDIEITVAEGFNNPEIKTKYGINPT